MESILGYVPEPALSLQTAIVWAVAKMWVKTRGEARQEFRGNLFTLATWLGQASVTSLALTMASMLIWSVAIATMLSVDWKSVLASLNQGLGRVFRRKSGATEETSPKGR